MEYEDRVRIATPEGVELELTLAGIGSRFTAAIFDLSIQGLLLLAVLLISTALGEGLGLAMLSIASFLIVFGYDVTFEVLASGRTPGKRWTGLRVIRSGGGPITFTTSALRNVVRVVDFLPVTYGVGMFCIFVTERNQRLGDLAAGTLVVRERHGGRRAAPLPTSFPEPELPHAGPGWDVSAISADEIAVVRSFLLRRFELNPDARAKLAGDLERRLRPKVAGAPPSLTGEDFLKQLSDAK